MSTTTDIHHPGASIAPTPAPSFSNFVFIEKGKYLLVAIPALIIQFVLFKLLYPFPDFISDSYSYIDTVLEHLSVNLWPIGYSRFIAALHASSPSDTFLVGVQFLLLEGALLLFFYTLLWFHRPAKNTSNILFVLLFFNPIFLYLSNCVLSDALFNTLSLLWWVQFIWMLHRPRIYQIFILAGLLYIAFTLRYTALYYPGLAIVAFALSGFPLKWKVLGSALCILVMIPFIEQVDPRIEAAARVFGAGTGRLFVYVLVPLLAPGILAALLLVLVRTIAMFELTFFTAGPDSQTLVVALYYAVYAAGVRAGQSIDAMAVIYMITTLIWLLIALRFVDPTQMVARAKQEAAR